MCSLGLRRKRNETGIQRKITEQGANVLQHFSLGEVSTKLLGTNSTTDSSKRHTMAQRPLTTIIKCYHWQCENRTQNPARDKVLYVMGTSAQ